MEVSHTQLTEVKDAPYDFQTFSLTSKEYQTRKESINTLFQTVQPHYDTFGVTLAFNPCFYAQLTYVIPDYH